MVGPVAVEDVVVVLEVVVGATVVDGSVLDDELEGVGLKVVVLDDVLKVVDDVVVEVELELTVVVLEDVELLELAIVVELTDDVVETTGDSIYI